MQIFKFENGINEEHVGCSFKQLQDKLNIEGINQYIAGFFDGEGSIDIIKNVNKNNGKARHTLIITFANTDLDILKRIQQFLINGHISPMQVKDKDKHKQGYHLVYHGIEAYKVLKVLVPYLIVRKGRANLAIEFYKRFENTKGGIELSNKEREIRESYYLKMRELNKRGPNNNDESINMQNELDEINDKCTDINQCSLFNY